MLLGEIGGCVYYFEFEHTRIGCAKILSNCGTNMLMIFVLPELMCREIDCGGSRNVKNLRLSKANLRKLRLCALRIRPRCSHRQLPVVGIARDVEIRYNMLRHRS